MATRKYVSCMRAYLGCQVMELFGLFGCFGFLDEALDLFVHH